MDLFLKSAGGTEPPELLLQTPLDKWPLAWSPDGRSMLFQSQDTKTGWDLWLLPMAGDRAPMPLVQTPFNEQEGEFSPDGRWVAYSSDESGRFEVYAQPFGTQGTRLQISPDGGSQPIWRRDGRELFYLSADRRLMAVGVRSTPTFEAGTPRPLFQVRISDLPFRNQYQASADGQRFLIATVSGEDAASGVAVVLNWPALLTR
jgi:dipeptidyl aminopeptidase/acylaminoacyl peptidase